MTISFGRFASVFACCTVQAVSAHTFVVLGDLHGDLSYLRQVLQHNGVLDDKDNWLDETTKVLSVGDTIGRGHQDKDILEFIKGMTEKHEGKWFQQLGNHEIMQLRNDFRYAVDGVCAAPGTCTDTPSWDNGSGKGCAWYADNRCSNCEYTGDTPASERNNPDQNCCACGKDQPPPGESGIGFGSLDARKKALAKGSELGDWLRTLPAIRQVGDNVFIHAGMSDPFNFGRTFADMNGEIKELLVESEPRHVYNDLIWSRDLVQEAAAGVPGACDIVKSVLDGIPGAARLFIGHTPVQGLGQKPGPDGRTDPLVLCDETLYDIDVGISRWMYANPVNMQLEVDDRTGATTGFKILHTPVKGGAGAPYVNVSGVPEETVVNATQREKALLHNLELLTHKK